MNVQEILTAFHDARNAYLELQNKIKAMAGTEDTNGSELLIAANLLDANGFHLASRVLRNPNNHRVATLIEELTLVWTADVIGKRHKVNVCSKTEQRAVGISLYTETIEAAALLSEHQIKTGGAHFVVSQLYELARLDNFKPYKIPDDTDYVSRVSSPHCQQQASDWLNRKPGQRFSGGYLEIGPPY